MKIASVHLRISSSAIVLTVPRIRFKGPDHATYFWLFILTLVGSRRFCSLKDIDFQTFFRRLFEFIHVSI